MLESRIFRAYDIRGIVEQNLSPEVVHHIGRSFAAQALASGQDRVLTGRDGRCSSPALHEALNQGLMESGVHVIDIGLVPTPILYFAALTSGATTGVMVTGSHNPAEYNGLKMVLNGKSLKEADILNLHERIERQDFIDGQGAVVKQDFIASYLHSIAEDIHLQKPLNDYWQQVEPPGLPIRQLPRPGEVVFVLIGLLYWIGSFYALAVLFAR